MLLSRYILQYSRGTHRVVLHGLLGRTRRQRSASRFERWARVNGVINQDLNGRLAVQRLVVVPHNAGSTFADTRALHRGVNGPSGHTTTSGRGIADISLRHLRLAVLAQALRQRKYRDAFRGLRRDLLRTLAKRVSHGEHILTTLAHCLISFIGVSSTLLHSHRVTIDNLCGPLRCNFRVITRVPHFDRYNNINSSRQRVRSLHRHLHGVHFTRTNQPRRRSVQFKRLRTNR